MKHFYLTFLILLLFLVPGSYRGLRGQTISWGVPFIQSFPKADYRAGTANWDVIQDIRGVLYFANNDGLLEFNGQDWRVYELPNKTILRSLQLSPEGSLFAGGQNEFGQFLPSAVGEWSFRDLRARIPSAHRQFEDVWEMTLLEDDLFFRASGKVYRYASDTTEVYTGGFTFLGNTGGQVLAQGQGGQLLRWNGAGFTAIGAAEGLQSMLLEFCLSRGERLILGTNGHGLYYWSEQGLVPFPEVTQAFLRANRCIDAVLLPDGRLAIGTTFAGVVIISEAGLIEQRLDRKNGLLNNAVNQLFLDRDLNLWVATSNGINYVQINSPFSKISPDNDLEGTGYCAAIYDERLYLGTNNGLYVKALNASATTPFQFVEGTRGQTWGLGILDGDLLLGHADGISVVRADAILPVDRSTGAWIFRPLAGSLPKFLVGTYEGLKIFRKEAGTWLLERDLEETIRESCRFLEYGGHDLYWVAHPYRGIFKISGLDAAGAPVQAERLGASEGLPSDLQNHLFKVKDALLFCGEQGVFNYEAEAERFVPDTLFNALFGRETKVRRLFEANTGDIWYITEEEVGRIAIEERGLDRKISKETFPMLRNLLNSGFETIYTFGTGEALISSEEGFIHYSGKSVQQVSKTFQVILDEVRVSGSDEVVFKGLFEQEGKVSTTQGPEGIPAFPHDLSGLYFQCSATDYGSNAALEFRYQLEGFDRQWSSWNRTRNKEYTNLPPGEYALYLQARNTAGALSAVLEYRFLILPPWHQTRLARGIFGALTFLFLGGLTLFLVRRYTNLKKDHALTVRQNKIEIGKLKEEKMQAELEHKKRELISATMHLVQKNETLTTIKEELIALKKKYPDLRKNRDLQRVIRLLEQEEVMEEGWEKILYHFNQLHDDFFNALKARYPDLTPKDLRLCAYLRMNLSSKEIAALMNISIRGIEASRYRLRRKLNLGKDDNLVECLMEI